MEDDHKRQVMRNQFKSSNILKNGVVADSVLPLKFVLSCS